MSGRGDSFWAGLPLGNGVAVLAWDGNGLAGLGKPAGVMTHPNEPGGTSRALLKAAYDLDSECYHWTGPDGSVRRLWLVNRLDSATSGVLLAAADGAVAEAARARFRHRQVTKVYQALVFGQPRSRSEVWRDRLSVEKSGGRIRSSAGAGVPAACRMLVERTGGGTPALALLRLEPSTGRSHQLRVQCARRGLPIVGDQNYGDFRLNREFARRTRQKRMFLHSLETRLGYELAGRRHEFSARAPLPEEFEAFL